MRKEDVIGWLEFLSKEEHVKSDGIVPCDTEIAIGMAIKALKQPEIVRCKDCRYAHLTYDGYCKYCDNYTDDEGNFIECYRPGDWYCAYGDQKDGEQDAGQ